MRVVLVRPWTDAHGGTGCCSGEARDGICLDRRVGHEHPLDTEVALVGETFRALTAELPQVDVQIVGSDNTAYLIPHTFRATRRRRGLVAALRAVNRGTTAGSVLVDGERVGEISALGLPGVLDEVRARLARGEHDTLAGDI